MNPNGVSSSHFHYRKPQMYLPLFLKKYICRLRLLWPKGAEFFANDKNRLSAKTVSSIEAYL
jgi:hypothetical protein